MNRFVAGLFACAFLCLASPGQAQQNNSYWLNYTGPAPWPPAAWTPVSPNNPLPVTTNGAQQVTPSAPSGLLTLTAGGTAQNLFSAGEVKNGCTIQNPAGASEPVSINFFTTAASGSSANSGGTTTLSLAVGQSVPCGLGLATAVSWNAATTGHAINAWKW